MNIKIKFIHAVLAICMGFSFMSCQKTNPRPDVKLGNPLIKSAEKYASLIEKRGDGPGSFTIEDLERDGDMLTIRIKGGCKEEDFTIVWDGTIAFSNPGQIHLALYNAADSTCDENNSLDIKVNLRQILDKHDPEKFMFHVANGSFKQDKSLNPNGSVISK